MKKSLIALFALSSIIVACGSEEGGFVDETTTITPATTTNTSNPTTSNPTATNTDTSSTASTATETTVTTSTTTTIQPTTTTYTTPTITQPTKCSKDIDCDVMSKCVIDEVGRSQCVNQCQFIPGECSGGYQGNKKYISVICDDPTISTFDEKYLKYLSTADFSNFPVATPYGPLTTCQYSGPNYLFFRLCCSSVYL